MSTPLHNGHPRCSIAALALLTVSLSTAQVVLNTSSYNQNFNAMGTTAGNVPTGFRISAGASPNWTTGTSVTTQAAGSTGTGVLTGSSSGGAYNFANGVNGSSTDRALGFLNSGSFTSPQSVLLRIDNATGATITALDITFNYEKYRSGSRAWAWTFFHGASATPGTAATTGDQSYAADANNTVISNPPLAVAKTVALTGLNIASGGSYYLRWTLTGNGGSTNGQAIGIDDLSITVPPPPMPAPVATLTELTSGMAASPLAAGTTDQPLFGFAASSTASTSTSPATQALSGLQLTTSNNSNGSLTNIRLIRSTDNDPNTTGDNTVVGMFTQNAGNIQLVGLSEALSATAKNYFIMANVVNGVTPSTPTLLLTMTQASTTLSGGTENTYTFTSDTYAFVGSGSPSLIATTLDAFGPICMDTPFPPTASFTLTGTDLGAGAITIGPLNGFTFFDANAFDYVPTLAVPQSGSLDLEVSVRFLPTATQGYTGSIPVNGGGASTTVPVSGSGVNTAPVAVTGTASNIGLSTVTATGILSAAGCSDPNVVGIEYSITNDFTPGTGTQVPAASVGDAWSVDLVGLQPCRTYFFRAYATNNGGTHHGVQSSFATSEPDAPVASAATTIFSTGFTANWEQVPGVTGYELDVSTLPSFAVQAFASDLFISEYAEGTGSNKYLEIYNGTGTPVNLANYSLRLYSNGSASISQQATLSGTLASGATAVYKNSSAAWTGTATALNSVINFNGDDAVALAKAGVNIDVLGTIGAATVFGTDVNLVRNASITQGSSTYNAGQWQTFPVNTESTLGNHTSAVPSSTPSFVTGYASLPVNGLSQAVTGLTLGQTYYYRVRAVIGTCESAASSTISVTTACDPVVIADVVSNSPICSVNELALAVTVASGETPYSYAWQGAGVFEPNTTSAEVSVNDAVTGTYSVTVSNGCSSDSAALGIGATPDTDDDGVCDDTDGCPEDPAKTAPGICGCGLPDTDIDNDGIADCNDPCDDTTAGQSCDDNDPCTVNDVITNCACAGTPGPDTDGDGVLDCEDECPNDPGQVLAGACGCGVPAVDADLDGIADCIDNCPGTANATQLDTDEDGIGDGCDTCPFDVNNDTDEDGICGNEDSCPDFFGEIGDVCDAEGGTGFLFGRISAGCACVPVACTENVTVELRTDALSAQASWEILMQDVEQVVCRFTAPADGITTPMTETCCLPQGCYRLRVSDSGGDGFVNGGYQLRESGANGRRIIDNTGNFNNGGSSTLAANYDHGAFCVPLGNDRPIFTTCDKLDWVNGQFIVATENVSVSGQYGVANTTSGYEFWFFDPNGSYSFRRFRNHATSDGTGTGALRANHFRINGWLNTVATPHIPQNALMNVRIRGRVNGVNQPFGPACLFKIDPTRATCPVVKLQDNPGNTADFSCGVSRVFGGVNSNGNKLVADPPQFTGVTPAVVSAHVRYQFRFRLPGEFPNPGSCIVRPMQTSPTLYLNWTTGDKLKCNTQYQVDVRVSRDAGVTWCVADADPCSAHSSAWGKVCSVNITNSSYCPASAQEEASSLSVGTPDEVVLFPNPNSGDQLHVWFAQVTTTAVSLDIFDLTGKRVWAKTIAPQEGAGKTMLDLNSDLASGVYMVNVTVGDKIHSERLVIER